MTTWVLESNVFDEECFHSMIEHFNEHNISHHVVRVTPFTYEIEGKIPNIPEDEPVIIYGSIGSQNLAKKYNWKPGVWTGDELNEDRVASYLGDKYLNFDGIVFSIHHLGDAISHMPEDLEVFIKPVADNKEFAGFVSNAGDLVAWYKRMIDIGYLTTDNFKVRLTKSKKVGTEYRCVFVDGKLVDYCIYKEFGIIRPRRDYNEEVEKTAQEAYDTYKVPFPAVVIDLGVHNGEYKVVEYNTFNSAGMYKCDVGKIIDAVNEAAKHNYGNQKTL